ncbi:alkaline phosphatase [Nocardioides sp. zg-579]|uniref:Alkaline phosphatase n=1 Tax=Nocardioides marmotae TaxID=2663857 RepID=A0A6I3J133_9ACTN|nr:alkaline phosphatase D family protein [Nocardioides marmotae]MCR6030332.1 alkaline phosphatase [Gordonia jinghuaiqii]MTB93966.1 alkaline phosphatase [Nocardioides marmotae]QKE00280.1 alkaline phosphatase [Nocardioides marmotae]
MTTTQPDRPSPAGSVGRRTVVATGAVGLGVATLAPAAADGPATSPASTSRRHRVFQHGIASGDPLPGAVVIWTRVTPTRAATAGSGRGPRTEVGWEVATDRSFRDVVRRGTFVTSAGRDHTVKLDVTGLRPATWYHYRFTAAGQRSRVGRTRTAPAPGASPRNLRFGVVSCANYQAGYFAAYRHLARRDDLHAVLHLGDYLYEYEAGRYGAGEVIVRRHEPAGEIVSLDDYRQRHAQYKTDPDLQDLHAKAPFITVWDDHETANDAWLEGAENHTPGSGPGGEGGWRRRRARALRAYDEWMPVRLDGTARLGDGTRLYRRLRFGTLAELSMLDLRTHRSEQVALPVLDPAVSEPDRTITGRQQMRWLKDSLARDAAQWKLVGNPVMIAPVTFAALPADLLTPVNDVTGLLPQDGLPYNVDQWDGYTDDRRELFAHIRDRGIRDTVFLTGDIHSGWASDLPFDRGLYPLAGETAGVEFVCSSVTSDNLKDILGVPPRTASRAVEQVIRTANPHIKYLDFDSHGYCVLDVTPARVQMDWYVIGSRLDRRTTATWSRSFATRAGTNTVVAVDRPVR